MKCKFISGIMLLFIAQYALSQPSATESKVDYGKGSKVAAHIELPYAPDVVEEAIEQYIARKGVKGTKSRDFQVYRNIKFKNSDDELNDLHFKVERKGRKDKEISMVYLVVGKPGENVSVRTKEDSHRVSEGRDFLNEMIPFIEAHNLEKDINEQEVTFGKVEKKMKTLTDEQKELEEKLATNKLNQEKQNAELEKQRTVLDAMKARRKN